MTKKRLLAYFCLLTNVLLWGVALPIAKKGFDAGLSPTVFLFLRMLIAGLLSLPIVFLLRLKAPKFNQLIQIVALEIIGQVIALVFLYEGLKQTTSIEATLISSTWPLMATLGGILFLREKERKNELVGLIIAVCGTLFIVARPLLDQKLNGHLTGNLYIFIYTLLNVAYFLLAKKMYTSLNKWLITFISFWTSTVGFGLILFTRSPLTLDLLPLTFWPLVAIIYMAIFGSILGLTLYLIGQDKIEASEAALFTYLNPLVAIPASYLLLHESINPLDFIGIAIIVVGVILAQKR